MENVEYIKYLSNKLNINKQEFFNYEGTPLEEYCKNFFPFAKKNFEYFLKDYELNDVDIFLKNNTNVNGAAVKDNNGHFYISINSGTIQAILSLFFKNSEKIEKISKDLNLGNLLDVLDVELSHFLFQNALLFLYYHESAHLIQLQYVEGFTFLEIRGNSDQFSIKNHVKETDADMFASVLMVKHIAKYWNKLDEHQKTLDNYYSLLAFSIIGSTFILLLFENFDNEIYYENKKHPHGFIRYFISFNTMIDFSEIELNNKRVELNKEEATEKCLDFFDSFFAALTSNEKLNKLKDSVKDLSKVVKYCKRLQELISKDSSLAINRRNELADSLTS